ncbi:hypothetical protein M2272_004111 [Mycobacterium frederiksbergense]|uniref:DUF4097 domain-containing protein n=1 Tax=Mycolicibacterium frederiksbergense TaxID=117567 RepID=A0ABT6L3F9_9MYCO|nr:DUF4097 family beta strand repeat-containing protein [Mycolicibacterium frederiksbergense]MDH6197456.1 hypothetical protein [Mycolicibacterium frederiksbergense]
MTITDAPPSSAPSLSTGGRRTIRVVLVAAAAVLVAGSIAGMGATAWGISKFRVVADTKSLPAAMRTLTIDTGSVPVAIRITTDRAATTPQVALHLVNTIRDDADPLTLAGEPADARVTVNVGSARVLPWGGAGELTVTLPPDVARHLSVTTRQETGVLLAQADLDELIAHTTYGPVLLSAAARRIAIDTDNGDVITREPISVTESFRANTAHGDVRIDFKDAAPRTVQAVSGDGDVSIALPGPGPYLLQTQAAGSTSVRVPQTSSARDAASEVTARSHNGDVVIATR